MQITPTCLPRRTEISPEESIQEIVKDMPSKDNAQVSHVVLLELPATIGNISLFWRL